MSDTNTNLNTQPAAQSVDQSSLNSLGNIFNGLNKACTKGVFDLRESNQLFHDFETIAAFIKEASEKNAPKK